MSRNVDGFFFLRILSHACMVVVVFAVFHCSNPFTFNLLFTVPLFSLNSSRTHY
jgi:hypothetical protein